MQTAHLNWDVWKAVRWFISLSLHVLYYLEFILSPCLMSKMSEEILILYEIKEQRIYLKIAINIFLNANCLFKLGDFEGCMA